MINTNIQYKFIVEKGSTLKINQSNGNVLVIIGITDAELSLIDGNLELISGEIDATEYVTEEEEKTIRDTYDTNKIDLAFYRIGHDMKSFISLDDELYNTYLEIYDKRLSAITTKELNLINGMIHIIQGIMNISHVLHDRSIDYSDDILWEAKVELEKIVEDKMNQYN